MTDSTTEATTETARGSERLERLVRRLRPGDEIEYETSTGHEVSHRVVEVTVEDGYDRVYAEGPRGGRYLLMPEKPAGMGNHPAPEVFWVNPDPDEGTNQYEAVTRGSLVSLSVTACWER